MGYSNMKEKPNYYAILPADIRYDKNIKFPSKIMYAEITALSNKMGYCWASNNYFAELYDVTPQAISKWINQLENAGYVYIKYVYEGKEIKQRNIYLSVSIDIDRVSTDIEGVSTDIEGVSTTVDRGYQQRIKDNNTSINTKDNIKNKYAPFVSLKESEYTKLISKYGKKKTQQFIDKLNAYKGSRGKKYKSDYLAILNWVVEHFEKMENNNVQANNFSQNSGNGITKKSFKYPAGKRLEELP